MDAWFRWCWEKVTTMEGTVTAPHTKRLARRFVVVAQVACDLREAGIAFQVLEAAERFLGAAMMAPGDRNEVASLIVATHQRLWHLRRVDGPPPRGWIGMVRSPVP